MLPNETATDAAAVRQMADEMEQFLLDQVERCEAELRRVTEAQQSAPAIDSQPAAVEAAPSIHQQHFQEERETWEAERQDETERLQKEASMLLDAWRRLEEEQRRVLAEKELVRRGLPAATEAAKPPAIAPTGRRDSVSLRPVGHDDSQVDEQSAWLQFQRMRREIQSHSRSRP